jgi:hydrogenase maturation protease
MTESILIAGIGNIFSGDDGFGVAVASRLAGLGVPANVRVVDYGIRGIDLAFALMEGYDVAILVDAVSRGGAPGTLYTIEPDPEDLEGDSAFDGAHGLDPVKVLGMAKSMGARLGRIVVVGCEPATLGDDSGFIGLSKPVAAAVGPAAEMVLSLVKETLAYARVSVTG